MPIARQHLCRRDCDQPQPLADVLLDSRIDVRVGAHRSGELAHGDRAPGADQSLTVAPHLQCPEGELEAERRRLGVDPVGAPDHRRVAELPSPNGDRRLQLRGSVEDQVAGLHQRHGEGGVDDVARRKAVVDPPSCRRPDALLHDVDEGRDVVVGDRLALVHGLGVEARPIADRGRVLPGDDAEIGPRLAGEHLHLEPGAEAMVVGEERRHLGQRVAGDHGPASSAAAAAMSLRKCMPGHEMRDTASYARRGRRRGSVPWPSRRGPAPPPSAGGRRLVGYPHGRPSPLRGPRRSRPRRSRHPCVATWGSHRSRARPSHTRRRRIGPLLPDGRAQTRSGGGTGRSRGGAPRLGTRGRRT